MKYKIHVPTVEYGFIEAEVEGDNEDAVEEHNDLLESYRGGLGLSRDEFNACLDRYLKEGTGETDVYLRMNKEQQNVIQELKKAFKRINKE